MPAPARQEPVRAPDADDREGDGADEQRRDTFILWTRTYPMFAFLRDDARYHALMARLEGRR